VLLRNNAGRDNQWIGFELQGTKSNRDAIGAKITVVIGDRRTVRWITGGSSYLSSHDKRVVFGLGPRTHAKTVSAQIRWPGGTLQELSDLKANHYYQVVETSPSTLPVTRAP
jgi:hypothetical protein